MQNNITIIIINTILLPLTSRLKSKSLIDVDSVVDENSQHLVSQQP